MIRPHDLHRSFLITLATCVIPWMAVRASPASDSALLEKAIETIALDDLRRHVEVLADDSLEGREAGSRGGQAAAKYLALLFQKYELKPAGEGGSFFQTFGSGYRNIIGMLPGEESEVGDEVIVIGAHYDHVGYGSQRNSFGPYGAIHNGADDNASGTASLIELIEAFYELGERPRRSILFCLWDGEEKGLLGSKHWLANPTLDLEQVRFSINLDMVGRLRKEGLSVYGERTSDGLRTLLSRQNQTQLKLAYNWDLKADSDHHPFIEKQIPTVMMHTGLHGEYHRPSDDIDTLNYEGLEEVCRYVARVAWHIANADEDWVFRSSAWRDSEVSRREFERSASAFPTRLGVAVTQSTSNRGLLILEVLPGSPAAQAGLVGGQSILQVNGVDIAGEEMFWDAVFSIDKTLELRVDSPDQEGPTNISVNLGGQPLKIGLSWRFDEGQTGIALISRVSRHSRADRAGLKAGQRIYRINGEVVNNDDDLQKRFGDAAGQLEVEVEFEGQISRHLLELPKVLP